MDKNFYIKSIEDVAGNPNKIVEGLYNNRKILGALGAGAGALGGAYLLSNKEDKAKIKNAYKTFKEKKRENEKKNKITKGLLRNGGALAGTAIALKSGKPIAKAIGDGGVAGFAIGDLVGSAALPLKELYSKHKEEFGTAPDAKSVAKVLGANALPSAALWGGLYSLKNGSVRKKMSDNIANNVNNFMDGKREVSNIFNKYTNDPLLMNQVGQKAVQQEINNAMAKTTQGALALPMAMVTPNMIKRHVTSLPGAFITPDSIIQKKKEIENKSKNIKE